MSRQGDDGREMPRHDPFDDGEIDALLAGISREPATANLSSFVEDVRAATEAVPTPSPALAAAMAAGGISTVEPPVAKWRKLRMKIQGFLAGLSIAGKLALGAGVAAAATTGAGAAGVLPEPVQHAMAKAVDAVTPFHLSDPDHSGSGDGQAAGGDTTTTTEPHSTPPTTVADGDGHGVVTPTTVAHHGDGGGTTPTTEHHGDTTPPTEPTTPTTEHHGDSNNPESLSIHCERSASPRFIACTWSASTNDGHARYALLRITSVDGPGHVICTTEDALHCVDTSVEPATGYGYRVISLRADGSVDSHSGVFTIMCCGDAPPPTEPTTPTTEHHDGTTTTTVH